jgi:hypothetical protein
MSSNQPIHPPLKIVEIDDEGWAAFKRVEGEQRREYAQSTEAIRDHEAWVNAPMADDEDWGSIPEEDWVEPVIAPNPNEIPWDQLYDWSLENTEDDTNQHSLDPEH